MAQINARTRFFLFIGPSSPRRRTPPYYGHASSTRIAGLYHIQGIDRIKMADDHDVK